MTARMLPVPEGLDGERLDQVLSRLTGLSRSAVARVIAEGHVKIDGQPVGKSTRVVAGSVLEFEIPPPPVAATEAAPVDGLQVLYSDDDIAVIDKPVGVAAHPSPGWQGPTVTGGLAAAGVPMARSGPQEREGIVHRLDVGTSGLMVVASSDRAYRSLKAQFRDRTVDKVYHALVQGHPDPASGTIDAPLGRHPTADHKFAVVAQGKPSVTHYDTLEAFAHASLLEIHLETGRTHQIRVHTAAIRHPCCGDLMYGADPVLADRLGLHRQWLHAHRLEFDHPGTGERVSFTSPYPEDLATALDRIRSPLC